MEENQNQPRQLADIRQRPAQELAMPDLKIDMFSLRGFELAQRIARAFATSDAVPAQFRSFNLKKTGNEEHWIENNSALGNCLVAVETAQAVGMSITAVMQNANIIEGKLSWSGKFVIAAVNASKRFTPLRFNIVNKGPIKAKYREKTGWDNQARKPIFTDREVELENIECTAWALPAGVEFPKGVATLDQAKAAGLPVIEGAPVSMEMAVQEGWYSKPGSKWQTGMKHLMLQYRAGAYFGNIHAPDVVMGMGRTTEEVIDTGNVIDVEPQPGGHYAANLDALRAGANSGTSGQQQPAREVSEAAQPDQAEAQPAATGDQAAADQGAGDQPAAEPADAAAVVAESTTKTAAQLTPEVSKAYEGLMNQIFKAPDLDKLAEAADLISTIPIEALRTQLNSMYRQRYTELTGGPGNDTQKAEEPKAPAKRTRGARSTGTAPE